jgi:hypothetical protein
MQIKEENPTISAPDMMKEVAARWRALSAEDKSPFEELAVADKARYY